MTKPLRIAILDAVPIHFQAVDEGISDGEKFRDLLVTADSRLLTDIFYVSEDEFPQALDTYDGFLLSGSPCSVHDDLAWIERLSQLIIEIRERGIPLVASCFGHQLVARTFGGEVAKNDIGWMIGCYPLTILQRFEWMRDSRESIDLYHFNKERVTRLPPGAISFARSESYPDFAYIIGENILCVQGHPEQPLRAMNNFLASCEPRMSSAEVRQARRQIDAAVPDAGVWGDWFVAFFRHQRHSCEAL